MIVKPLKEREKKTAEEIKHTVKVFAPTEKGLKVAGVRKAYTGLVVTFAITIYGMERSIEKDDLVKVVHA